jgi:hypothetical protein
VEEVILKRVFKKNALFEKKENLAGVAAEAQV